MDKTTTLATATKTKADALAALKRLEMFMNGVQLAIMRDCIQHSEESEYFIETACRLAHLVETMPVTYQQEGKGNEATVYLHYFTGGCDWWITEKDIDGEKDGGHYQAFGLSCFGDAPEVGYIAIPELLENGVELDFHFTPCSLGEVREKKG